MKAGPSLFGYSLGESLESNFRQRLLYTFSVPLLENNWQQRLRNTSFGYSSGEAPTRILDWHFNADETAFPHFECAFLTH
jgi:hypothetical protein